MGLYSKLFILLFLFLAACGKHDSSNSSFTETNQVDTGPKASTPEAKLLIAIDQNNKTDFDTQVVLVTDINAPLSNGETFLIHAIKQAKPFFVEALLEHGADPMLADKSGNTPLAAAQASGSTEILLILDHDNQLAEQQNILFDAVTNKDVDLMLQLLAAGVNPNFIHASGETPLTQAIIVSSLNTLRQLSGWIDPEGKTSTNVNMANASGKMPLTLAKEIDATQPGKFTKKIVDQLIRLGAQE
jgi:ankyrin repeat protein